MAKNKHICNRYAQVEVNGKNVDSRLHRDLLQKINIRPVANLVYAMYLQDGVADAMDAKYPRNSQGQHNVSAVLKFLNFQNIVNDIGESTIRDVEVSKGIRDRQTNSLINFTDPLEAINKAKEVNELRTRTGDSRHLAATVVRHGTDYQVLVDAVSSYTHTRAQDIDNRLFLWDKVKEAMAFQGVDLDALRVPYRDILTLDVSMINYLENMARTNNRYLTKRELEFLLASDNSQYSTDLINRFGDVERAAQAAYDNYHITGNTGFAGLIERAINHAKGNFSVLDSNFNAQSIDLVETENAASGEAAVTTKLKELNQKYGIDFKEIKLENKHVKSLSEAAAKAVTILESRINKLETQRGTLDDRKKLSGLRDKLLKEIESKRYYSGLLDYLQEASDVVLALEDKLNNAPTNGTDFENALERARILATQDVYTDGYINLFRDLLGDLTNIDRLTIDESITQDEINQVRDAAKTTYEKLIKLKERSEELNQDCMKDLLTHILGNKVGPEVIANVTALCCASNWGTELFYSFGKLSNPVCAAIGDLTRTAEDDRNDELMVYTNRIREANAKLHASGSNSEYMYEDDGHIVSNYDWKAYNRALGKERVALRSQGLRGFDLEEALEQWIELNTDELEVDHVSGRTERVPKLSLYRKNGPSFRDGWTAAQNEYYDTMMQIKGEIGTLLPDWAQNQFLPPQLRRDLITAVTHEAGVSKDAIKNLLTAVKDKAEELYSVKEDDADWGFNGAKTPTYTNIDLSGRQAKSIPIFFVHKLSNQDELFRNFSAGVQALAATALNYHYMSQVLDVAEFMRSYFTEKTGYASKNGVPIENEAGNKTVRIVSNVIDKTEGVLSTRGILNNLFDKHFYAENIKNNPYFAQVMKRLTWYTSFKGLSSNYIGAFANLAVGEQQLFQFGLSNTLLKIFSKSKTPYFGITDWALGLTKLFGAPLELAASAVTANKVPSLIYDLCSNNKTSLDYLISEYFDLFNENYGSMMHTKYYKGIRQYLHDPSFLLYGAGEKAIRYNALFAMLNARKVEIDGKKTSLRNIFIKEGYKGAPHLALKPNVSVDGVDITDANGELTKEGKQFMRTFKKDLRYCCQGMFGAMNEEDKGSIHQYALGCAAMNFRQWMVGHYSERFRGVHWDYDKKEFVRGYYTSTGRYLKRALTTEEARDLYEDGQRWKFIGQLAKDLLLFRNNWRKEWAAASETERLDLMRVMSAVISYGLLFGLTCWFGGGLLPKFGGIIPVGDRKEEEERRKAMTPEEKFIYYQLRRLVFEADASFPIGAFLNAETMLKSPIPALRTFDNALYFITGLGDLGTPLLSGPDAGMDKYWRNVLKYNLPFWRDIRRFQEWGEDDTAFMMFNDRNIFGF